jgi:hypothetical protein
MERRGEEGGPWCVWIFWDDEHKQSNQKQVLN